MAEGNITVPPEWAALDVDAWRGLVLIFGGPSTGKSTLGRYIYLRLRSFGLKVAYLAADVGQQELGPPATMTLALSGDSQKGAFPPDGQRRMVFVGSNTPRGHMIPILLGVHRLQQWALKEGAAATVVDTSGFIKPEHGAAVLKWAKVDLLKPSILVSLQRETELEPLLEPLRPLFESRCFELPVSHAARERPPDERKAHRSKAYRAYFREAQLISLSLTRKAIFPEHVASTLNFIPGQLVAMEDDSGFALALGVVKRFDPGQHALWLHTPWWGQGKITTIRMGGIGLDLDSFYDELI